MQQVLLAHQERSSHPWCQLVLSQDFLSICCLIEEYTDIVLANILPTWNSLYLFDRT